MDIAHRLRARTIANALRLPLGQFKGFGHLDQHAGGQLAYRHHLKQLAFTLHSAHRGVTGAQSMDTRP